MKLDDLLSQNEPLEIKTTYQPSAVEEVNITDYALKKARTYAKIACYKAKRTMECGGYLIAPKDSTDYIATDAFLASNQDVSEGLFTVKAEDVIQAGREIAAMDHKVVGWWHSHGFMDTFFSSTDDTGQMTVLNAIAPFNYYETENRKSISEVIYKDNNSILFADPINFNQYQIKTNDPNTLIEVLEKKHIGFAYGIVVNARPKAEDLYCELATRAEANNKSKVVGVNIHDVEQQTILKELVKEFDAKVNYRKPSFFHGIQRVFKGKRRRKRKRKYEILERKPFVSSPVHPSQRKAYYTRSHDPRIRRIINPEED